MILSDKKVTRKFYSQ